jgi:predicted nucleotide-binding protein (sugar kinase/HSP70/actin superfamily)
MAAVKAQVDFIESRFAGKGMTPSVTVHRHCGESGAIGAAIEALRLWRDGRETAFIGMEGVRGISFVTHRSEDTRCHFCKNTCLRTFIDVAVDGSHVDESDRPSKIPVAPGVRRLIVGNSCERGLVEDVDAMRIIKKGMDSNRKAYPNYMRIAAERVWRSASPPNVADPPPSMPITTGQWRRKALLANRERIRIGIPRVLNLYSTNPLFSGYFESLGVHPRNLVYSSFTNDTMYKAGAKRGAVDPCFPSKVCIPHVHDLLHRVHAKNPLDLVFFPMMDALPSPLSETMDCRACPTVTATPEAVKAAFTKEGDLFAELGVRYVNTFVNVDQPRLFERQMWDEFRDILGLTRAEHRRAVDAGYDALERYERELQGDARETLEGLEKDERLGIVVLGRPYHNDPGICHEILDEFQRIGYPAFTEQSLPTDDDIVWRLFGEEVRAGLVADPMDISDVWKNSYSENTNKKVWAAKYAARHPNLVALELSSFKCGHDAPIYTTVEEIVQTSGTPYFCFKDIDENKPTGSIRIRVETIGYFLERYRQEMMRTRAKELELERRLAEFERRLRAETASEEGAGVTPSVTGR